MAFETGYISRALGCKLGVVLGEVSFSVYMLHYILLLAWAQHAQDVSSWPPGAAPALFLVVLTVGAFGLWRFVERPARAKITSYRLIDGKSRERRPIAENWVAVVVPDQGRSG
jgi:peptidoglycan/LPS O-acetylase OafA/YrhL